MLGTSFNLFNIEILKMSRIYNIDQKFLIELDSSYGNDLYIYCQAW